jgi:Plastocyanin
MLTLDRGGLSDDAPVLAGLRKDPHSGSVDQTMRALLATTIAMLALVAAGCGGGGDKSSSSSSSSGSSGTSTPTAATPGTSTDAIDIKGFAFNPADGSVKVGTKVTWTNSDSTAHNVVADDGSFKSETLNQGDSYSFTPTKAGTFDYVCTFHANMKATLTVTG